MRRLRVVPRLVLVRRIVAPLDLVFLSRLAVAVARKRIVLRPRCDRGQTHVETDGDGVVHADEPARTVMAHPLYAPVAVAVPALFKVGR